MNRYFYNPQYAPTQEEEEVAYKIIRDFCENPDPFPLCEKAIKNLIAFYVDDCNKRNVIRNDIVSSIVISSCGGYKAVFVSYRKGEELIHWYITKTIDELQRAITANYIICGRSGADAESGGIAVGEEISYSNVLLAVVFRDKCEENREGAQ